jgi:hypothetical protein
MLVLERQRMPIGDQDFARGELILIFVGYKLKVIGALEPELN